MEEDDDDDDDANNFLFSRQFLLEVSDIKFCENLPSGS
jgi:hypothetical protein